MASAEACKSCGKFNCAAVGMTAPAAAVFARMMRQEINRDQEWAVRVARTAELDGTTP